MTRRGSTRRSPVRRGAAMRLAWNGVPLALLRSREATKSLLTWGERCSHRTPKSLKKLFCLVRPTKSLVVRSNCVRKGCSCIHENSGSAAISFPSLNRDQIHRETPLLIVSTFCGLRCRFWPKISDGRRRGHTLQRKTDQHPPPLFFAKKVPPISSKIQGISVSSGTASRAEEIPGENLHLRPQKVDTISSGVSRCI